MPARGASSFALCTGTGGVARAAEDAMLGTIKKIADGEPWTMPVTIDDPAILDEIGGAEVARGAR